jgi:hypothetical protein
MRQAKLGFPVTYTDIIYNTGDHSLGFLTHAIGKGHKTDVWKQIDMLDFTCFIPERILSITILILSHANLKKL